MKLGWRRLLPGSPFSRVVWGLALGILTGVFLGEPAGSLKIFGDAYVRLLQMTVVPYVFVSLISGLGRLGVDHARQLGARGGVLILFLWGLTLATLVALPLGYPDWESGAFFSTTLISEKQQFDPLLLYIPANPFYSLANTILPAVVVFSILVGIALISVPNKEGLLRGLDNLSQTLMRITNWVVKLTPYGIFAIAASASGTMRPEALEKLQIYLWVYVAIWTILTFLVLPMLVSRSTAFSFGEVLRRARTVMITAIATGSVLVVLPMIADSCKELLRKHGLDSPDSRTTVDVLVPTAYSFPSAGTLLGLGFILFAAWYAGSPLAADQYPQFLIMGMLTAFGQMVVALPFLLDMFRLPADLFQLYLLGGVVTARLATGLAAMHGVVICLLGATALMGAMSWRRLIQVAAAGLALSFVAMAALGFVLTKVIPYEYQGGDTFVSMRILGPTAPVVSSDDIRPAPLALPDRSRDRLSVVKERGTLRVGYLPEHLPFAYRNNLGEVVGFDMEIIHRMASDLNLRLEIVRLEPEEIVESLETGTVDLVASGLAIIPLRAAERAFSTPYSHHTVGFLVRDHERSMFSSLKKLRSIHDLTIGVPATKYIEQPVSNWLPRAKLVPVDTPRPFLRGEMPGVDGILGSAEGAGAWSLIYPQFSVAVPSDLSVRVPMAFALPQGQPDWLNFVNSWINLATSSGIVDRAFSRWILGQQLGTEESRWSIMRNVLGWGLDEVKQPSGAPGL
ncbi:MAG: cation:dicarboxylase symporter family transporter [Gammaproteobacteria bacterium]|jgi:Na+/H+-dicarboxylate symporter